MYGGHWVCGEAWVGVFLGVSEIRISGICIVYGLILLISISRPTAYLTQFGQKVDWEHEFWKHIVRPFEHILGIETYLRNKMEITHACSAFSCSISSLKKGRNGILLFRLLRETKILLTENAVESPVRAPVSAASKGESRGRETKIYVWEATFSQCKCTLEMN